MARALFWVQRYQGLIGLAILLIVAAFLTGSTFFSHQNLQNVLNRVAVPGTLAVGMTFVILTGGIDLSVGSMLALLNCIVATWCRSETPLILTACYVLFLGALLGGINGAIIGWTKMQPFVVTLAAMVSLRGASFLYTHNSNVSGLGDAMTPMQQVVYGLPFSAWILLIAVMLATVVLNKTVFGRNVFALGGSEAASRIAGINTNRIRIGAYAINGFCVGLAALIFTARTNNGQPGAAVGYELDAIAAVVVGGASLLGGVGSALGSLVGAVFIACTDILLTLKGIDDKVGLGLKGIVILLAVYLQNLGRDRSQIRSG